MKVRGVILIILLNASLLLQKMARVIVIGKCLAPNRFGALDSNH